MQKINKNNLLSSDNSSKNNQNHNENNINLNNKECSIEEDYLKYELDFEKFNFVYKNKILNNNLDDILLLDFRHEDEIYNGIIPKSIVCDTKFFPKLIQKSSSILFIASPYYEEEVISFLKTNGYHNIIGYLKDGIDNWILNKGTLTLFQETSNPQAVDTIIDCREPREWNYGVVKCDSIQYMQLAKISQSWKKLSNNKTYGVVCKRGGRSLAATTYLMSKGVKVMNFEGGIRNLICNGFKLVKKF